MNQSRGKRASGRGKGKGNTKQDSVGPELNVEVPAAGPFARPPEPGKGDLQVIVLGPTGGPREDRVTGILVRSTSTSWRPDTVIAVDAGTLLSGIIHILETHNDMDEMVAQAGPFTDMSLPFQTAPANAAHILREVIGPILVTHPHLDHFSGFAMNSPILEATNGPKTVAALPSVISAIKTHIFNEVIWPNLSDEDGGAGLITYQRLQEGGNPRMGRDEMRGYTRACEGLYYRCFGVSHGCTRRHYTPESEMRRSLSTAMYLGDPFMMRSASRAAISLTQEEPGYMSPAMRRPSNPRDTWTSVESSAFFIREQHSGREIIIFGDVEPDSISVEPRNRRVWEAAAPRIVSGKLRAIFIECSYTDDVEDESLYGHLCPRHLIAELKVLASEVVKARYPSSSGTGKRKRASRETPADSQPTSPKTRRSQDVLPGSSTAAITSAPQAVPGSSTDPSGTQAIGALAEKSNWPHDEAPLVSLSVYLIHIKEDMDGGPCPSDTIVAQLRDQAQAANLGCEFHAPKRGESVHI
ncbi:cAMP phosphodiesterases class-II-domain-containing protein [Aspergillus pseudonomiae]|uniref:cAMP phosphodiesterases class-II-domain-containing protein n=1 Tax=Aspergillus pseudonomiae TaxID=1506151 RepID=A0A5N7D8Y1_9EURO|nr:cAMP phosphodiesterases class-II-domain-containing protein [Aspergillus pseudonomiae]KAE8402729.1 cAMP phosphodiesterases class-II-domain-containing protein [Aspergillus pseudonomiae]